MWRFADERNQGIHPSQHARSRAPCPHEHPDFPGVTVVKVRGFGRVVGREQSEHTSFGRTEMAKLECIVEDHMAGDVTDVIREHAATGRPGDGKVVISDLGTVIRIRTGESGASALACTRVYVRGG